jgi:hypothetical protein
VIVAALILLLCLGIAVALRVAGRTHLAAIVGFAVGTAFIGCTALITFGLLFGD